MKLRKIYINTLKNIKLFWFKISLQTLTENCIVKLSPNKIMPVLRRIDILLASCWGEGFSKHLVDMLSNKCSVWSLYRTQVENSKPDQKLNMLQLLHCNWTTTKPANQIASNPY
mgnify:CR=1 FL=1